MATKPTLTLSFPHEDWSRGHAIEVYRVEAIEGGHHYPSVGNMLPKPELVDLRKRFKVAIVKATQKAEACVG